MSLNNTLNAVIALIDNRPDIARMYFRDPKSDVKNIGEATARLYAAIDKRVATDIRALEIKILSVAPDEKEVNEDYIKGFYDGVRDVEIILEEYSDKCG